MDEQWVKPAMASGLGNLIGDPRIGGVASQAQDPHQLLARILADEWTWRRFKLQKQFTVLTALALHHYLDPDLAGVTRENPYECLNLLAEDLRDIPGNPVAVLLNQTSSAREWIRCGALRTVAEGPTLLQSLTTAEYFIEFIVGSESLGIEPYRWRLAGEKLTFSHVTPLLRLLSEASGLWALQGEGGTYEPGWMWTAPDDVEGYLLARGVKSEHLAKAMATLVRPASAIPGRRRHPPKWWTPRTGNT